MQRGGRVQCEGCDSEGVLGGCNRAGAIGSLGSQGSLFSFNLQFFHHAEPELGIAFKSLYNIMS